MAKAKYTILPTDDKAIDGFFDDTNGATACSVSVKTTDGEDHVEDHMTPLQKDVQRKLDAAMTGNPGGPPDRKGKLVLYCLKSYSVIFGIFFICMVGYLTVSGVGVGNGDMKRENEEDYNGIKIKTGYKELRLGNRRVFYREMESVGMTNHTVLLIHGNSANSEMFTKLGTMKFLSDHGASALAIDIIGYGKSDPPMHLVDNYEGFFEEVVDIFELEYNLILVCIEAGCDKILPYYLNHGVYRKENSFIEGAVFVSPQGDSFHKFVQPDKYNIPTSVRTLVVNGAQDEYLNLEVVGNMSLVPRTEIHALPDLKNNFYKTVKAKGYFHAALQAFIQGLEYTYDQDMNEISAQVSNGFNQQQINVAGSDQQNTVNRQQLNQQQFNQQPINHQQINQQLPVAANTQYQPNANNQFQQNGQYQNQVGFNNRFQQAQYQNSGQTQLQNGVYQNNQQGNGNRFPLQNFIPGFQNNAAPQQQMPQQLGVAQQGGDLFGKFKQKQNIRNKFQDLGYDPVHRFSNIKGKRRK